jgi:peptide deformylase
MAVKDIVKYPDSRLKVVSNSVKQIDKFILQTIKDLSDTLDAYSHTVGIAAPQIGISLRIIIIDASKKRGCIENHGKLVLINPEIYSYDGLLQFREGCLSVPDFTANINRAKEVSVYYYDTAFKRQFIKALDFEAVLLQHEIDHLNGVLFLDRVISKRTDLFRRKKYK